MPPFELQGFVPYLLSVAAARVSRRFAERYQAEAGLSMPEWRVLAHLAGAEAVSVRDIHSRVDMDKSKVSRAAARLEELGLIAKAGNPEDARLVALSLTEEGRRLMQRMAVIAEAFQAELLAELGPDAIALQTALKRLAERPAR